MPDFDIMHCVCVCVRSSTSIIHYIVIYVFVPFIYAQKIIFEAICVNGGRAAYKIYNTYY